MNRIAKVITLLVFTSPAIAIEGGNSERLKSGVDYLPQNEILLSIGGMRPSRPPISIELASGGGKSPKWPVPPELAIGGGNINRIGEQLLASGGIRPPRPPIPPVIYVVPKDDRNS